MVTLPAIVLFIALLRVQRIVSAESLEVDLSALQNAMYSLQNASANLDLEKVQAETELRHFIEKWIKRRRSWRFKRLAKNVIRKIRGLFGIGQGSASQTQEEQIVIPLPLDVANGRRTTIKPRIGRYPGWLEEQERQTAYGLAIEAGVGDQLFLDVDSSFSALPHKFPFKKFKHLVRQVQAVNKKLTAFERGFISKGGIKDREWYRHLGVAPGRWLGEHFFN